MIAEEQPEARLGQQSNVACVVYDDIEGAAPGRFGNGARVYLGSAELGAVTTSMGKLPTPAEYLAVYKEKIAPKADSIYQYLQFDEMDGYK